MFSILLLTNIKKSKETESSHTRTLSVVGRTMDNTFLISSYGAEGRIARRELETQFKHTFLLVSYKTFPGSGHVLHRGLNMRSLAPQGPYYHKTLMLHVIVLPFSHFSTIINQNKHTALDNKAFIFGTNQTTH